jgi:hypothetical protein
MLKISVTSTPYYDNLGGINDSSTSELSVTFQDDASSLEIFAKMIKILEYMGYTKQTKKLWLRYGNLLTEDGYLTNDMEMCESQEND